MSTYLKSYMKKNYSFLLMFFGALSFAQTFYSENFGTPSGTTLITGYSGWQVGSPVTYSGSGDVRTTGASSGYAGASGSGNIFLTSTAGRNLIISNINSSAFNQADIQLSFGYLTSSVATQLVVETSTNGTTWTPITFTQNTTTTWNLVTVLGGQIPSSTTLSLRFTQPATASMRIDDVKLSSVSSSCTLVLGAATTTCSASTLALDTYSVSIPFSGAGNATYVITPTSGTVGGDNPTAVATGNIIISGVTENTPYSVSITGGTCNFTTNGNSPECKPLNALTFQEPFNYTVGSSLGAQQTWSNLNSGDLITVESGNLTYGTLAGTGNSVSFSGAGIETFSPFTPTTSGTIYAGFMFSVTDLSNVTDGVDSYFAVLTDAAKNFKLRLFTKRVASQYQIGFDSAATTTNYDTTLRNIGDVVYVIMGYDFATNTVVNVWINPNLATFSSATPPTLTATTPAIADLGGFVLRQDGSTSTPTIKVDEIKIAALAAEYNLSSATFSQIDGLKLYPNPTKNSLYIETAINSTIYVSIVDLLGKEVINTKVANNLVNVSNLTAGIYIVKITEEGKTATKKLIIN